MNKLNENETKALNAIIDTCDDLDGYLFTRLTDAIVALCALFGDGHVAGGYYASLLDKGYLSLEPDDFYGMGLWVERC